MRGKRLSSGQTSYYWEAPQWARPYAHQPPVLAKPLGQSYADAVRECDEVLNPAFDSWCRTKDLSEAERKATYAAEAADRLVPGSFRWVARKFEASRDFERVDALTKAHYREGLQLISEFKLRKDPAGRTFGDLMVSSIDADAADAILDAIEIRPSGGKRMRRTYKAMQAARRAWNVMARRAANIVPLHNPFSKSGRKKPKAGASQEATYAELQAFMAVADEQGHPSMSAAALMAWEWMIRETTLVERQSWAHYKSKKKPGVILILHDKTDVELEMPLYAADGTPLFPELEARLAELPRRGTLMIMRDTKDRIRKEYLPYQMRKFQLLARQLLDDAKLQHLKFESFRKGGETECGNADLTDQQIMALDGHKTRDMLTVYAARNKKQRIQGMEKRRAARTK
jgi:hypothetical protein